MYVSLDLFRFGTLLFLFLIPILLVVVANNIAKTNASKKAESGEKKDMISYVEWIKKGQ